MKKTSLIIATLVALTGIAQAAQVWDIANNKVTDSRSINFNNTGTLAITDILQFNSATAAFEEGVAGSYVLTSVTLAISGSSMAGSFLFLNTLPTSGVITSASFDAGQGLTFTAAGSSTMQTMTYTALGLPITMDPNSSFEQFFNPEMGVPGSRTINSGLAAFTGTGNLADTSASFSAKTLSGGDAGTGVIGYGSGVANFSVTYNYALVPEPTSMALLALGCAVLGLRRRNRTQKV